MKKLLYVLPVLALLAAGCNSSTTTPAATEQSASQPVPASQPETVQSASGSDSTPSPAPVTPSTNSAPIARAPAPTPMPAPIPPVTVKAFTVSGSNFAFSPNKLTVNKGDKVKITFQNSGGSHDFVLDGYNVKTAILGSGQAATVEFTADKTGTFSFYCSVGNHRAMGMAGTLTVQ